jgi:shikimate dehydrogenase
MITSSVIGWPINHSRSPLIHGYWLTKHGLAGRYDKIAVEQKNLAAFIDSLRHGDHVGTNVTLPHKEAAIPYVDEPDDRVRRIGALNTIWRENGKLHATSTDGPGFVASLKQTFPGFTFQNRQILILGAGGSARSLVDEILREGAAEITIQNRTQERGEAIAKHFGPRIKALQKPDLQQTDLVINTTSAGLHGDDGLHIDWKQLQGSAIVADIVYTPLITPLLIDAQKHGHRILPGLGMLLHQAVVGFEKWFGVKPVVTKELHDLIARDIDPDYVP